MSTQRGGGQGGGRYSLQGKVGGASRRVVTVPHDPVHSGTAVPARPLRARVRGTAAFGRDATQARVPFGSRSPVGGYTSSRRNCGYFRNFCYATIVIYPLELKIS